MPIFRAIGLGILIVILGFLVPDIVREGERTMVLFLRGAGASALSATELIENASTSPSAPRRLTLPKAPSTTPF